MTTEFDVLKKSREMVLKTIQNLTLEQLHTIPEGFKNNIIWNFTHIVVTQQLLHYKLSGLQCLIPDDLIDKYRKGTFPSEEMSEEEFEEVKELFMGLPDTLQEDYEAGIFKLYNEYQTSTGFVLTSIKDAIAFNNLHEGLHLGVIMSLVKLV
jgi:hypothetical protein